MHKDQLVAFVAFMVCATNPATAKYPFEGRWAERPEWCDPNFNGMIDEQAITITAKSFEMYVAWCRIDKITRKGSGFHLSMMCRDEGDEENHPSHPLTDIVTVEGAHLRVESEGSIWNFQRCPPLAEPKPAFGDRTLGDANDCPTCWLKTSPCLGNFLLRPQIC